MNYRIKHVEAVRYPVVRVTFDDDLSGEYDLSAVIDDGPIFGRLKDQDYFRTVAAAPDGRTFGWNLMELGKEIDFCPDAVRIAIETHMVEDLAAHYRSRRPAAE